MPVMFSDFAARALNAAAEGNWGALIALLFVAAFTEVGIPFPFVMDSALFVVSYQTGLSVRVLLIMLALLVGRQLGSATIYWLTRFLGKAFTSWLEKRSPSLRNKLDHLMDKLKHRGFLSVAIARLTPGLLTAATVAFGASGSRYHSFVLGVTLSSIIADGALVALGFGSAHGLSRLGLDISIWMVAGALAIALFLLWAVRRFALRGAKTLNG